MDSKLEHTLRLRHLEQLKRLPINQSPPPVKRLPGNQLHVTPAWINQATTDTLSIIQEAVASGASRLPTSCTHTHGCDQARAASTLLGSVLCVEMHRLTRLAASRTSHGTSHFSRSWRARPSTSGACTGRVRSPALIIWAETSTSSRRQLPPSRRAWMGTRWISCAPPMHPSKRWYVSTHLQDRRLLTTSAGEHVGPRLHDCLWSVSPITSLILPLNALRSRRRAYAPPPLGARSRAHRTTPRATGGGTALTQASLFRARPHSRGPASPSRCSSPAPIRARADGRRAR
jgi:hypothetical protein